MFKKILTSSVVMTSALAIYTSPLYAGQSADPLQHRVSLYLWGAGMSGNMGNAAGAAPVDISFGDILDNFEAGIMANYRLKGGKWAFNLDYIYLNVTPSADKPPADVDLKQTIVEASAGYELRPELDLVAGIRYVDIDVNATINLTPKPPSLAAADDWIDPVIGLDYRRSMSDKWRFYGRADVGGFGVGSDLSYQLAAYFGYMPSDRWNLYAGYRHLDFDYKSDNDKKFFYDVTLSGPLAGFGYHF
jgi:predicted porin